MTSDSIGNKYLITGIGCYLSGIPYTIKRCDSCDRISTDLTEHLRSGEDAETAKLQVLSSVTTTFLWRQASLCGRYRPGKYGSIKQDKITQSRCGRFFDKQKQQKHRYEQDNCQHKVYEELRVKKNYIKTLKTGNKFIDFVSSVTRRNGMWGIDLSTTNLNVLVSVFLDILPLAFKVEYIETFAGIGMFPMVYVGLIFADRYDSTYIANWIGFILPYIHLKGNLNLPSWRVGWKIPPIYAGAEMFFRGYLPCHGR
jgi:hypothetical protein